MCKNGTHHRWNHVLITESKCKCGATIVTLRHRQRRICRACQKANRKANRIAASERYHMAQQEAS